MQTIIVLYEAEIRASVFGGIFFGMAIWELIAPRRSLKISRLVRWSCNIGIVVINTAVLRLMFPAATVGASVFAASQNWGLFNMVAWPIWVEALLSLVLLDLLIYCQHVMFHAVPVFWRIHRVHHADLDFDVSTGVRFHPAEIVLSMFVKMAAVLLLGAGVFTVIIFESLLNATSMFNHGNVRLGSSVDKWVRKIVVTPDMHRVHHSVIVNETNSNFGFNLAFWDRLFGTYRAAPKVAQESMTIGLETFRQEDEQTLWSLLLMPLRDGQQRPPFGRTGGK